MTARDHARKTRQRRRRAERRPAAWPLLPRGKAARRRWLDKEFIESIKAVEHRAAQVGKKLSTSLLAMVAGYDELLASMSPLVYRRGPLQAWQQDFLDRMFSRAKRPLSSYSIGGHTRPTQLVSNPGGPDLVIVDDPISWSKFDMAVGLVESPEPYDVNEALVEGAIGQLCQSVELDVERMFRNHRPAPPKVQG